MRAAISELLLFGACGYFRQLLCAQRSNALSNSWLIRAEAAADFGSFNFDKSKSF
jgi:hypothetical protein